MGHRGRSQGQIRRAGECGGAEGKGSKEGRRTSQAGLSIASISHIAPNSSSIPQWICWMLVTAAMSAPWPARRTSQSAQHRQTPSAWVLNRAPVISAPGQDAIDSMSRWYGQVTGLTTLSDPWSTPHLPDTLQHGWVRAGVGRGGGCWGPDRINR